MDNDFLNNFNESQIKPVTETQGPVLVIAGAGSGKTRVLTGRIAYLVNNLHVAPRNILAITFTNKAANEMKERLSAMVEGCEDMWVSTIHSMCTRILRANIAMLGYEKNFTVYSDVERERVLKKLVTDQTPDDKYFKNLKFHVGNAKMLGLSPREYLDENPTVRDIGKYCAAYAEYEKELKRSNALDFDDLLLKTRELLESNDSVCDYYNEKFTYVHVDEFQDTNGVQYDIIKLLTKKRKNIFVVGDDDQSIYGWRGAEIRNILNFEKDFVGAKVYKLEQNYRSTGRILKLANKVISHNSTRKVKELWTENADGVKPECFMAQDETAEAAYTAMQIKMLIERGVRPSSIAVLMRLNALSRPYEQEFMKYNIPCKVFGGFKFYERKEIKDIIAYLRILNNPLDNDAVLRVLNVPKRGIGDKTVDTLSEYAEKYGLCLYDAIIDCDKLGLSAGVVAKLNQFKKLIISLIIDSETVTLEQLFDSVVEKTEYMKMFESDTNENMSKRANVSELKNSIIEYSNLNKESSLSEFLASVTLSSDTDEINDGEYVTLATVHAVKGLEFGTVFICGLEETVFPISRASNNDDELEEERRLMYVAITRARERLYFTYASSRFLFGNRVYNVRSRFLNDIAEDLGLKRPQAVAPRRDYRADEEEISIAAPVSQGYSSAFVKTQFNSKPEVKTDEFSGFTLGRRVNHVKFGEGIIIKVKGSGKNTIVDVAFKGVGVKSLAAQFAPMKLL